MQNPQRAEQCAGAEMSTGELVHQIGGVIGHWPESIGWRKAIGFPTKNPASIAPAGFPEWWS